MQVNASVSRSKLGNANGFSDTIRRGIREIIFSGPSLETTFRRQRDPVTNGKGSSTRLRAIAQPLHDRAVHFSIHDNRVGVTELF
jgi:hypothetical protein